MLKRNGTCWIPGRVRQVQDSVYVLLGMLSQDAIVPPILVANPSSVSSIVSSSVSNSVSSSVQ